MSAVSLGKIDKYEYLAGEKRLLSDQSRMIKQEKEKQRNTTKEQGKKQIEVLEVIKPEEN